jgi:type VI protein secretion system component Hcp
MATKKASKRSKHLRKAKRLEATKPLSKTVDAASPKFFNNCCAGAHYQTVSL